VADAVVSVEHRQREEDAARLPDPEERGRGLRDLREQHRHPVAGLQPCVQEPAGEPGGHVLHVSPRELADVAVGILVDHRELPARVLVAHVDGDVVARRHVPAMRRAGLLVALHCDAHGSPPLHGCAYYSA